MTRWHDEPLNHRVRGLLVVLVRHGARAGKETRDDLDGVVLAGHGENEPVRQRDMAVRRKGVDKERMTEVVRVVDFELAGLGGVGSEHGAHLALLNAHDALGKLGHVGGDEGVLALLPAQRVVPDGASFLLDLKEELPVAAAGVNEQLLVPVPRVHNDVDFRNRGFAGPRVLYVLRRETNDADRAVKGGDDAVVPTVPAAPPNRARHGRDAQRAQRRHLNRIRSISNNRMIWREMGREG